MVACFQVRKIFQREDFEEEIIVDMKGLGLSFVAANYCSGCLVDGYELTMKGGNNGGVIIKMGSVL